MIHSPIRLNYLLLKVTLSGALTTLKFSDTMELSITEKKKKNAHGVFECPLGVESGTASVQNHTFQVLLEKEPLVQRRERACPRKQKCIPIPFCALGP